MKRCYSILAKFSPIPKLSTYIFTYIKLHSVNCFIRPWPRLHYMLVKIKMLKQMIRNMRVYQWRNDPIYVLLCYFQILYCICYVIILCYYVVLQYYVTIYCDYVLLVCCVMFCFGVLSCYVVQFCVMLCIFKYLRVTMSFNPTLTNGCQF